MQQSVELEFQWYRDTKGYEIVNTPWPEGVPLAPIADWPVRDERIFTRGPLHPFELRSAPPRIVRLGGELVPYRPLEQLDAIFRAYINLPIGPPDPAAAAFLDFIDRYGPLSRLGLDQNQGDDLGYALGTLGRLNTFIDARLADDSSVMRRLFGEGQIDVAGVVPILSYDPGIRAPKLRFCLPSLQVALGLHLMRSFDSGAAFRRCEWERCGIVFEAGAGTGRPADSKFCCDQHRIAYHSVHRTPRPTADKEPARRRGRPRRTTS